MIDLHDGVVWKFREGADIGNDGSYSGGHDATQTPRSCAYRPLAQTNRDVRFVNASLKFLQRNVAGYSHVILHPAAPDNLLKLGKVRGRSDERVMKIMSSAKTRQRA